MRREGWLSAQGVRPSFAAATVDYLPLDREDCRRRMMPSAIVASPIRRKLRRETPVNGSVPLTFCAGSGCAATACTLGFAACALSTPDAIFGASVGFPTCWGPYC